MLIFVFNLVIDLQNPREYWDIRLELDLQIDEELITPISSNILKNNYDILESLKKNPSHLIELQKKKKKLIRDGLVLFLLHVLLLVLIFNHDCLSFTKVWNTTHNGDSIDFVNSCLQMFNQRLGIIENPHQNGAGL